MAKKQSPAPKPAPAPKLPTVAATHKAVAKSNRDAIARSKGKK